LTSSEELWDLAIQPEKKIDELARYGDKHRFKMPIALRNRSGYDFSFSGLKTAAFKVIQEKDFLKDNQNIYDLCSSLQYAIVSALLEKTFKAARELNISHIVIGGGVAANSYLRSSLSDRSVEEKIKLFLPGSRHCTDNAVMIARAALIKINNDQKSSLTLDVSASMPIELKDDLYR